MAKAHWFLMTRLLFIEILRSCWEESGCIRHQQRLLLLLPVIHLWSTKLAKRLHQSFPISCGSTLATNCALHHLHVLYHTATFHLMDIFQPVLMPISRSEKKKLNLQQFIHCPCVSAKVGVTRLLNAVQCFFPSKPHYFWPCCLFSTETSSHFRPDFLAKLACVLERMISWVFAVQSRVRLCENGRDVLRNVINKMLRIVLFPGGSCVLLVQLSVSVVLGVKGKVLLRFDCHGKCV